MIPKREGMKVENYIGFSRFLSAKQLNLKKKLERDSWSTVNFWFRWLQFDEKIFDPRRFFFIDTEKILLFEFSTSECPSI